MPRRRNKNRTNLPQRTLQSVEQQFGRLRVQRAGFLSGVLPNYIRCRMDPFTTSTTGSSGTPDAAMVNRIVVDHRDYATLTVGTAGSFQVRLFPCLPYPLAFRSLGTDLAGFSVNGVSVAASTATTAGSNVGWIPIIIMNEWVTWIAQTSASPTTEVAGPYSEVKARIIAFAVKIFYTGAASAASGTITFTADRSVLGGTISANVATAIYNATAAGTNNSTQSTQKLDFGGTTQLLDANSITERPEVPMRVVPRRLDENKPWLAREQIPWLAVDSSTGNSVFTFTPLTGAIPNIALYDDGWEIGVLNFNGVATGTIFRFETAVCVEYQPVLTSAVAKLTKKPAKVAGAETLTRIESELSKQPIAQSDTKPPDVGAIVAGAQQSVADVRRPDNGQPNKTGVKPPKQTTGPAGNRPTISTATKKRSTGKPVQSVGRAPVNRRRPR